MQIHNLMAQRRQCTAKDKTERIVLNVALRVGGKDQPRSRVQVPPGVPKQGGVGKAATRVSQCGGLGIRRVAGAQCGIIKICLMPLAEDGMIETGGNYDSINTDQRNRNWCG